MIFNTRMRMTFRLDESAYVPPKISCGKCHKNIAHTEIFFLEDGRIFDADSKKQQSCTSWCIYRSEMVLLRNGYLFATKGAIEQRGEKMV